MSLPYLNIDKDFYLDSLLVLSVIDKLSLNRSKRRVLSFDRLQLFYYLATRPTVANKLLSEYSKPQLRLTSCELYTVSSIAADSESLFNKEPLRQSLMYLVDQAYVDIEHSDKEGFVFGVTDRGHQTISDLEAVYFKRINDLLDKLRAILTSPVNGLFKSLSKILQQDK